MHARLREVIECLDGEFAALRDAVDSVPLGRRNERPAADRWSVAEVLEHLAAVERTILKVCTRQLSAAREAGLGAETETTSIRAGMPPERVANRERPLVSPPTLVPRGMDAEAAWAEVALTRAQFVDFVKTCDGLAIGQISFPHPAFGNLDMYQWLLFAAGHHARHAAQIREIALQLQSRRTGHTHADQEPGTTPQVR